MGLNAAPHVTYGFIGIGNMGFGMAMNIRVKIPTTSKLVICDTNKARTDEFLKKAGGNTEGAVSPREVAEKAVGILILTYMVARLTEFEMQEIILTSLPHGPAVHAVYTDPNIGLLSIPKPQSPKLFIEMSTIEIGIATDVRNRVLESEIGEVIDSPVSGGIISATQGDLSIMTGGTAEQYAKAKPVLEMMGIPQNIFHCGPSGHGLATKLINNYCNFINYAVLCEGKSLKSPVSNDYAFVLTIDLGMNAGVRYGLNPKLLAVM